MSPELKSSDWACPVLTSKSFNQKEVGRFWVPYKRGPPSLIQMRWGPRKGPTACLGFFESYTPPTRKAAPVSKGNSEWPVFLGTLSAPTWGSRRKTVRKGWAEQSQA